MSLDGQRIQPGRYAIIPRTLIFLTRPGEVLLIKNAPGRGAWAGLLNGVGGHLERGESPHSGAVREIQEETGLTALGLRLVGAVVIDTGSSPGIGLYVFVGKVTGGNPRRTEEGLPQWVPYDRLDQEPLMQDLPQLLPRALEAYEAGLPFTALYRYDADGRLEITFDDA